MGLALVVGPAKAGKIARLLEGYLEEIERDPVLIVPNRADVDRIERDLLERAGALLAGSIGTFDDVFRELALAGDGHPSGRERCAADARRAARARAHAAERARPLGALRRLRRRAARRRSASSSPACSSPSSWTATSALLYAAYREELDRLGLWDRDLLRAVPSSACAPSSTPGTAGPSSPTASRT